MHEEYTLDWSQSKVFLVTILSVSKLSTDQTIFINRFYRAMHYSAKRGIAIACHPSIRLSVTLVDQDHTGWKSRKLIARTIKPTPSLFVAQRPSTYSQGNIGKFGGD